MTIIILVSRSCCIIAHFEVVLEVVWGAISAKIIVSLLLGIGVFLLRIIFYYQAPVYIIRHYFLLLGIIFIIRLESMQ